MFGFGKKRKEEQQRLNSIKQRVDICYSLLGAEAVASLMPMKIIKPSFNDRDELKIFLFTDVSVHTLMSDLLTEKEIDTFIFDNVFAQDGVFKDFDFSISGGIRQTVEEGLDADDKELFEVVEAAEGAVMEVISGNYEPGVLRACLH